MGRRMLVVCCYSLYRCSPGKIIEVVSNHRFSLFKGNGKWECRESLGRKKAEEVLGKSEETFRNIFEEIADGVSILVDGKHVLVNRAFAEIFGYSAEEMIGRGPELVIVPEELPGLLARMRDRLAGKDVPTRYETLGLKKDGTRIRLDVSAKVVSFENKPAIQIIVRDSTERHRLWEALHQNEEFYRHIFEHSPVGVGPATLDGKIVNANKVMWLITGYTSEELREINLTDIYAHKETRKKLLEAVGLHGDVTDFPVRLKRKDGTVYDALLNVSLVNIGGTDFLHTICQDITERKKAEKELKKSHRELRNLARHLRESTEKERRRIAGELHDELGQILTALKMDCAWMAKNIPAKKNLLKEKLKDATNLLNTAVATVRKITADLRPPLLDDLGLVPALERMADGFAKRTGIKVELLAKESEIKLNKDTENAVFHVVQEALTNVARYADAKKVRVVLRKGNGKLVVSVADDGKGITAKQAGSHDSLGLLGMKERIRSLRGTLKITGRKGKGTTLEALIPLKSSLPL